MSVASFAQTSVWFFGNNGGLRFNSNGTTSAQTGSAMTTNEGCSAATDASGNLLFYGDGQRIYHGGTNALLTSSLLGSASSTQSSIVVPVPGNECTKFLVFSTEGIEVTPPIPNGLSMTLVTVSGIAPAHTVTIGTPMSVKASGLAFAEKLAVTPDGAGGYWLVAHDLGTTFYKYHITNTAPFTSATTTAAARTALLANETTQTIGSTHGSSSYNAQGQMKFSKSGTKLGLAIAGSRVAETYLFNLTTGVLTTDKSFTVNPSTSNLYGFEFSPDGDKVFVAQSFTAVPGNTAYVYQYDISVAVPTQYTVASQAVTASSGDGRYPFNGLQLGPNDKIYVCGPFPGTSTLSVINTPNAYGAPGYSASSVTISGTARHNLPTVIAGQVSCDVPSNNGCNCSDFSATLQSLNLTNASGSATASFQLNSGTNLVKKVRITLLNYSLTLSSSLCKNYATIGNNDFGKFTNPAGALTGFTSTLSPSAPMTSPLASYDIEYTTNTPRVLNDLINCNLKFPPILALSCCSQTVNACFRVEFIDADCRICDVMICNSQGQAAVAPNGDQTMQQETASPEGGDRMNPPASQLKVFPNPNNGNFVIDTKAIGEGCNYQLITVDGREIQKGAIRGDQHEINNLNLQPGTYSVYVFKENQVFTEQIIVTR